MVPNGASMRLNGGTPLMAVLVAMALSVPHVHAHATTPSPSVRASEGRGRWGDARGGVVAPVPSALGYAPGKGPRREGGVALALAARGLHAMYALMTLCGERGWSLEPGVDDRYVVTTRMDAATADGDRL